MINQIDKNNIPQHIAIIMDGNGRWAKNKGAARIFGHKSAVTSVREVIEGCGELNVKYLTLYAFSTENWNRPQNEVNALMELLVSTLRTEVNELVKNNIKLCAIGNLKSLPEECQRELEEVMKITANNTQLHLTLALSYSARWEITEAARAIALDVKNNIISPEQITENLFSCYLNTRHMPDPELLIRTSGEMRISNFLLWQIAYSEIYITHILWPDFRKQHLFEAVLDYQKRERRFGRTSEQLLSKNR
ncbi:MAG: isoprenyl transferase [Cytophagaceae bacterium]|nr:isoprenyl transferase [Cytophagaceae bacterium]MDW8455528.1 isoprenyl transferase [Cytophagaceae bacterium]